MTSKALANSYAKKIRDAFAPIIPRDRRVALIDFPDNANCGDHAIWLGEKTLLAELDLPLAYQCSAQTYDRDEMAAKLGNGTILMHGGTNLGDRHEQCREFRLRILTDFPANKIIAFPLQVAFMENECLKDTASLVAKHPDVTLFARGVVAQHLLTRYFEAARVELAPDMAFMLGPQRRTNEPIADIVWIARTDQERANDRTEIAARLSSQPAEKFVLPEFPDGIEINFVVKQRPPTVLLTDWHSLFFENEQARLNFRQLDFDARSKVYVSRALHMLSLGHLVITDRLHAHVLCLMLGVPHIFLNNDSGKNWNFYESWTREAALCRLAPSPAEAWALARAALPKLKALKGAEVENWTWQGFAAATSQIT